MQNDNLSASLMDFVSYEVVDGLKTRALPIKQEQLMSNGFTSLGYHFIVKQPIRQLERWVPMTSQPYADELFKFFGELGTMYVYKMLMGKPYGDIGGMVLKQLMAQGGQLVLRSL